MGIGQLMWCILCCNVEFSGFIIAKQFSFAHILLGNVSFYTHTHTYTDKRDMLSFLLKIQKNTALENFRFNQ